MERDGHSKQQLEQDDGGGWTTVQRHKHSKQQRGGQRGGGFQRGHGGRGGGGGRGRGGRGHCRGRGGRGGWQGGGRGDFGGGGGGGGGRGRGRGNWGGSRGGRGDFRGYWREGQDWSGEGRGGREDWGGNRGYGGRGGYEDDEQEQYLIRPSKRQQRHDSDQKAALEPVGAVLAGLSPDLWRLVCSFVAESPLWLFVTWARVCKRANGPSARPAAPFALDLCKIVGGLTWLNPKWAVPSTVWREWKELTRLTLPDVEATRRQVFAALAASRTRVHAIALNEMRDSDLAGAAGVHGLCSLELRHKGFGRKPRVWVTDAGLVHLSSLHNLRYLDLRYCVQLTDAGLVHLSGLHSLCHLNLRGCWQLTDAGLVHLSGLRNLQYLDLGECEQLTEAGLAHLVSGLDSLRHLDLYGRLPLTHPRLVHISGHHNLRIER